VTKIPYIPISPIILVCPQCGAKAGKACKMLRGEVELIHVERIMDAAAKDVAAKNELTANTPYGKSGTRKLRKVLDRMARNAPDAGKKWT